MKPLLCLLACVLLISGAVAAQPTEPAAITSRVVRGVDDGTHILAVASSPDRSLLGVLVEQPEAVSNTQRPGLLIHADRPASQAPVAIMPKLDLLRGSGALLDSAGLAIDAEGGRALVALATARGALVLASADLRETPGAATRIQTIQLGTEHLTIKRMLIGKSGELLLAGSVDGKGFITALTSDGKQVWRRTIGAGVAQVLDLTEVNDGWIWVGIAPAGFATGHVRLGHVDSRGAVTELPSQAADAETRFARLSRSGDQLGLVYERFNGIDMSSEVYLEVFPLSTGRESHRRVLFNGELGSRFTIAAIDRGFVVAGVAAGGMLVVDRVDAELTISALLRTTVKAPAYRWSHGVEVLAGPGYLWLVAMESTAQDRRQRLELTVSRLEIR